MFDDLIALFEGWYSTYVSSIRNLLEVTNTVTDAEGTVTVTTVVPEIWSAYVPWEALIAAGVLCLFLVLFFRLLRSILCQTL